LRQGGKNRNKIRCQRIELRGPKASFIRYASGIRDYYEVLKTAYSARVGVNPSILKDMPLMGLSGVIMYEVPLTPPQPHLGQKKDGIK